MAEVERRSAPVCSLDQTAGCLQVDGFVCILCNVLAVLWSSFIDSKNCNKSYVNDLARGLYRMAFCAGDLGQKP